MMYSIVVFLLGHQWLALPTACVKEVALRRPVHRIPHRPDRLGLGIVNLNGELKLCVALDRFLGMVATMPAAPCAPGHAALMMAIIKEADVWVFGIDAIEGVFHYEAAALSPPPTPAASPGYLAGLLSLGDREVAILDEGLLFAGLATLLDQGA